MKRALAWLAGLAGIATLGRLLARRQHGDMVELEPLSPPLGDAGADPAAKLRRKLAEQRPGSVASEPSVDPDSVPAVESLAERRARVHAKAREAIEAMDDDGPAA